MNRETTDKIIDINTLSGYTIRRFAFRKPTSIIRNSYALLGRMFRNWTCHSKFSGK